MINKSKMDQRSNLKEEKTVLLYLIEDCSHEAETFIFLIIDCFLFCQPIRSAKSSNTNSGKISGSEGYDTNEQAAKNNLCRGGKR